MTNAAELLRLIHNLVRLGTIAEMDHETARCRVKVGALKTGWLKWMSARAGTTIDWDPPTVGEQVVLLSPGGDLGAAVAVTGLYQQAHSAPVNDPKLWHRAFPDGASIQYDHESHVADITLPSGATLNLMSDGGINITGDTTITGNVAITGDLAASGDVSDGVRSMAGDRDIYNGHTHQMGEVPKPDQEQ